MSAHTTAEIEYLKSRRLGRLATIGRDGAPHVTPKRIVTFGLESAEGRQAWESIGRDVAANPAESSR